MALERLQDSEDIFIFGKRGLFFLGVCTHSPYRCRRGGREKWCALNKRVMCAAQGEKEQGKKGGTHVQ